ncbi:hypothetical protein Q4Q34_15240 [Flavivirga abyssicola]|uniref:DUF5018-related domain-containing protein n=1 Tax=Flavivirga abyssicola TaxID=3063533 RepID=UPI0026E0692E|nr:hypothetical protein [Flavivirga sp. MEBiC07777]WVK12570.1 hypothetical protein Q4Q34_15240 [Flavivirga sp. MEBiC07777]
MNKLIKYIPIIVLGLLLTSCLTSDLDELPTFENADIIDFRFEYRWIDNSSEFSKLKVQSLNRTITIDTISNTVNCTITVPASDDDFPDSVRADVTLSNIVGFADLTTAASMKPIGNAPVLGKVGDFSLSTIQYEVTAANNTVKVWSLIIDDFVK